MRKVVLTAAVLAGMCSMALAGEFGQWRGPQRNGVGPEGPPLAASWPAGGPAKLWQAGEFGGGDTRGGGFGCVSVSGGRAYVFCHFCYRDPFKTRTLSETSLVKQLGWFAKRPPAELEKAIEDARVGEERTQLDERARQAAQAAARPPARPATAPAAGETRTNPPERQVDLVKEWVTKWIEDNIKDQGQRQEFAPFATDRLTRGKRAWPLDELDKLATIKDKEFADQESLDKWYADNQISEPVKKAVAAVIPTYTEKAADHLYCMDAASGQALWKFQSDGDNGRAASSTPCVAGDRVYFAGSAGDVYCVNAATGEKVWQTKARQPAKDKENLIHSSVLVSDGMAVVAADPLIGLDAASGTVVWRQAKATGRDSSPVTWKSGDKTYVLCNAGNREVVCVDILSGSLVWSVPGGGQSTVVVAGDHLAVFASGREKGLTVYKLAADKPTKLWSVADLNEPAASPIIYKDHVFVVAKDATACVELASGKVLWREKVGMGHASPVLADGKIFVIVSKELHMVSASPDKYELLAKVAAPESRTAAGTIPYAQYTTPVVVDGKLYLRLTRGVGCYDLTGKASAPAAGGQ